MCASIEHLLGRSIDVKQMPIYFQTVMHLSATKSRLMVLPSAAGLVLSVLTAGFMTAKLGYYHPSMLLTGILMPIAAGLATTLSISTQLWRLIIYQALLGLGAGVGFQGPQLAMQAIFPEDDSQIGIAIIQFAQGLGPAVFAAVAQNIFTAMLKRDLQRYAPELDFTDLNQGDLIVSTGQRGGDQGTTTLIFSKALAQIFYLPVSSACLCIIGAIGIEWRSLKA